jgi:hypothetical protein
MAELVTGALEIDRWLVTTVSSKNAMMVLLTFGWYWVLSEAVKRYLKRPACRRAAWGLIVVSCISLVNALGAVPPI